MKIDPKDLKQVSQKAKTDPVWWIENVLGDKLWEKQKDVVRSVVTNRETSVKSCHATGKSFMASRIALWFLYNHAPSVVITTAPTDRQVRGILWKEITSAHSRARFPLGGDVITKQIKIASDWFAWGFTAPDYDPDRFQGFHSENMLVVVDEAAGVSPKIYEGIASILAGEHSRLLNIGNPTDETGDFGKSFKRSSTGRFTISAFDTPNLAEFGITVEDIEQNKFKDKITGPLPRPYLITPQFVHDSFSRWGSSSPFWQSRILAEFPSSATDSLISWHLIERAQRTERRRGAVSIGVDVARFGSDETIVVVKDGNFSRVVESWQGLDTMQTTGKIKQLVDKFDPVVTNVDVIGVGGGVVDRLKEIGCHVDGVNVGEGAKEKDKFVNKRAELFWNLREAFERGEVALDDGDEELATQLSEIKYKVTSKGKIQIESKDDMRRRGFSSPDRADALALACNLQRVFDIPALDMTTSGLERVSPWSF